MPVALEISALRHPFPFLDPALDRVPQAMAVRIPALRPVVGARRTMLSDAMRERLTPR
jgi:hypothetical protein